jgi:hypothetical protein
VPRETAHANGVAGIGTLTVAVPDESVIRTWYAPVAPAGAAVVREDLAARGVAFTVGPHRLEFLVPGSGSGPIAEAIRTRGAGPYMATLSTSGAAALIDPGRAGGARLTLVKSAAPR